MQFLYLLFIAASIGVSATYRLDPDFGWHLRLGQEMYARHSLIHDFPGYASQFKDLHFIDHQWLSHLLLWPLYQLIGYPGLIILFTGILFACLWLVYCLVPKAHRGLAWWLAISPFLYTIQSVFGVRLQLFLLLGAALLLVIERSRLSANQKLSAYFLCFLIGNNLHGGFLLLTLIPLILHFPSNKKEVGFLVRLLLTLLFAVSLHAYGFEYWKLSLAYLRDSESRQFIAEWQSLLNLQLETFQWILPLVMTLFIFGLNRFFLTLPWRKKLLLVVFFVLGFRSIRFFPLFLLLAVPEMALGWSLNLKGRGDRLVPGLALLLCLHLILLQEFYLIGSGLDPVKAESYPKSAAKFLITRPECKDHLYNPYGWGGYLTGFYPELPVFQDGRMPFVIANPQGDTLLHVANQLTKGSKNADALLEKYSITCILLQKVRPSQPGTLNRWLNYLITPNRPPFKTFTEQIGAHLEESKKWDKSFEDSVSIVYILKKEAL